MTDHRFTTLNGSDYLVMQSKDAKLLLGISKTQFYNDADREGWTKKEGTRGAVFYHVPREYVERRQADRNPVNDTEPQPAPTLNRPAEPTPDPTLATTERPDHLTLDDTVRQLLAEKDQRIAELASMLERERQLTQEIIKAKDSQVQTLQGTVHLLVDKNKVVEATEQTLEYAPVQQAKPLWQFWKR